MRSTVLMSCAAVVLALAGSAYFFKQHGASFQHLHDAKARFDAAGYFCTSDNANGHVGCGFLISRKATTWNETGMLCKAGPMGPQWQGKVWVTLNPDYWQLQSIPDNAGTRVWGAVVAFGDDDMLREIDALLNPAGIL